MRVAAVQTECTPDRERNLTTAAALVERAAGQGARLVALPELFASLGSARRMVELAEPLDGPTRAWASALARRHEIWLLAGSMVERAPGDRLFNTALLLGPDGVLEATYRKIHLFDVEVAGAASRESDVFSGGEDVVTATVDGLTVALATCYDLRFPEVFRIATLRGATMVLLPSAFTAVTGRDHWEVLVRARAIENQAFVLAPDQCGTSADGIARYGHSLVVDPWGRVLADGGDAEGVVSVDLAEASVERARSQLPSLNNRRPEAYRWPG